MKKGSTLIIAVLVMIGMMAVTEAKKQSKYAQFMNYYMENPDIIPKRPPVVQANSLSAFTTNIWDLISQPGT